MSDWLNQRKLFSQRGQKTLLRWYCIVTELSTAWSAYHWLSRSFLLPGILVPSTGGTYSGRTQHQAPSIGQVQQSTNYMMAWLVHYTKYSTVPSLAGAYIRVQHGTKQKVSTALYQVKHRTKYSIVPSTAPYQVQHHTKYSIIPSTAWVQHRIKYSMGTAQ